jgi:hypothetical protein
LTIPLLVFEKCNIGGIIFGAGLYCNQSGVVSCAAMGGCLGVNKVSPEHSLDVSGTTQTDKLRIAVVPTSGNTNDMVLVRNASGEIKQILTSDIGGGSVVTPTVNNGLSIDGSNIVLGGTLTSDTIISGDYNLGLGIAPTEKLDVNGDAYIRSGATIAGNLNVFGDIVQSGSGYTTHVEHIYTKDDFITLRDGAIAEIAPNDISGLAITKANGVDNVLLGSDNEAVMRIGWSGGTLQAIATREDNPIDGGITYWNDTNTQLSTDSKLHWDDVNKRLGIGTTTPSQKLQVNGQGMAINTETSNESRFLFYAGGDGNNADLRMYDAKNSGKNKIISN